MTTARPSSSGNVTPSKCWDDSAILIDMSKDDRKGSPVSSASASAEAAVGTPASADRTGVACSGATGSGATGAASRARVPRAPPRALGCHGHRVA